ncbi:MAG: hypothetical protein AAB770_01770 [Patescibacteria group bacterium]
MTRLANIFLRLREQSSRWLSRTFIVLLLAFLFFVALGGVSHNDRWQISQLDITGIKTVSEDAVRALAKEKLLGNYFFVYSRNNSYLFPKKEIELSIIETFPRLATVSVNRTDNRALEINTSERKPYALWCGQNVTPSLVDCWFIDEAGFVFDHAPVFSGGVYLEVYSKLIEKNVGVPLRASLPHSRFISADTFVKLLEREVGDPLRIILKPEGEAEIIIRASEAYPFLLGVTIRFKDEESPAVLIKRLHSAISKEFPDNVALKKKLLYIDMRFGNKIFFGFEN